MSRSGRARASRVVAVAGLAIAAGLGAWWMADRSAGAGRGGSPAGGLDRRADPPPLSGTARRWLVDERASVRRAAEAFEVSPVALGGIVAAEKTLLVGRVDAVGEELFRAVFGSLRERDLERWVADQEAAFRRDVEAGTSAERGVRHPYLWTLGPAQVTFRLAVQYEPVVARRLGRPERSLKDVLEAVTSVDGNLEYAAALLADAQRAYLEIAGFDIADDPGVLATLYQLGSPRVRARRLADENAARRARGERPLAPRVNAYGAFVRGHAAEIAELLAVAATAAARSR